MFSDFDKATRTKDGRGRRTVSFVMAAVLFGILAAVVSVAVATHSRISQRDREVVVEFASLEEPESEPEPEPEPEPPPPRAVRPAAVDRVPDAIPDERPEESEGELVPAEGTGPVDGTRDGVEGGVGQVEPEPGPRPVRPRPRPRQEHVEVTRPARIGGCNAPERPPSLEGQTAELIRVRVRIVIDTDGLVMRSTIVDGHPLIEDDLVLSCVNSQVYERPTLEGIPVPYVMSLVYTFRPDTEI